MAARIDRLVQINLQSGCGGGEIYTAFLCRALADLGLRTRLLVHPQATHWGRLGLPADTELVAVSDPAALPTLIPDGPQWLLAHGPLPVSLRTPAPQRWRTAIAHMPVQDRKPQDFAAHDRVYAVSGWVRDGLLAAGLPAWHYPLYGVADLAARAGDGMLRRASRYDWDRRKGRDRLLGLVEPLVEALRPARPFIRRPGLSLGIVSRLTPIKQFPLLFSLLAPVLARHPTVNLEIFGAGGYASVRDLEQALRPCAGQVRFWGQQTDVAAVYRQLDALMTGLPEKEALGLNILEAESCGLPVLAVQAPPFDETVTEGVTGFFYRDPRLDQGADFDRLLQELLAGRRLEHPEQAREHLAHFSFAAFVERLRPVVADATARLALDA